MMYKHLMVCCLKANGKVLREMGDVVKIPFGQEYSILLKNLNTKRGIVNITIDGTDVAPGGLVINGNSEIELERFIKDLSTGNRFKFIERTTNIEDHRGIKVDDGLIRISFKYEKNIPIQQYINSSIYRGLDNRTFGQDVYSKGLSSRGIQCSTSQTSNVNFSAQSNVGITVPGSLSSQQFVTVDNFETDTEEHVLVIKLLGQVGDKIVKTPIAVTRKPECTICGKLNKATANFCSECGASLQIV